MTTVLGTEGLSWINIRLIYHLLLYQKTTSELRCATSFIAQFDRIPLYLSLKHVFKCMLGATFENFVKFLRHILLQFPYLIELQE